MRKIVLRFVWNRSLLSILGCIYSIESIASMPRRADEVYSVTNAEISSGNFPHVLFFPYQQEGAVPSSPSSFRPGAPDCVGAFSSTWQFVSGGAVAAAAETCFERRG